MERSIMLGAVLTWSPIVTTSSKLPQVTATLATRPYLSWRRCQEERPHTTSQQWSEAVEPWSLTTLTGTSTMSTRAGILQVQTICSSKEESIVVAVTFLARLAIRMTHRKRNESQLWKCSKNTCLPKVAALPVARHNLMLDSVQKSSQK